MSIAHARSTAALRYVGLLCLMLCSSALSERTSERVRLVRHGHRIDVSIAGRPFTTYFFDPAQAKPYLQPLRNADGVIVTRDFPTGNLVPDGHQRDRSLEPHQRPLYFAHGDINGLNFWAEEAFARFYGPQTLPYGRTVFRRLTAMSGGADAGVLRAEFTLEGAREGAIGKETQAFVFAGDASTRTIDAAFTLTADQGPLTIGDTKEGAFAIRVAPELTAPAGRMINSRGGQGEQEIWGKQAEWVEYDGTIGGKPVGVAILDSPRNFRHPTYWHARGYGLFAVNPFGLRAFTGNESRDGRYTISLGASLTLRYRVVIHAGDYEQARIEDIYRGYAAKEQSARDP